MKKKILTIGIAAATIMILALSVPYTDSAKDEPAPHETQPDVIMPTKSSRPGCDDTNSCYIPSEVTVIEGQSVTWMNQDSAFHSVTSGFYGNSTGLFDSDYMDPYDLFSFTFLESGRYDYHCTLHPWMKGHVIVERYPRESNPLV